MREYRDHYVQHAVVIAEYDPGWPVRFRVEKRLLLEVSDEYASLKRRVAAEYQTDRLGYSQAKTDFILSTLNQASS